MSINNYDSTAPSKLSSVDKRGSANKVDNINENSDDDKKKQKNV
jgi:hypothetical protein